MGCGSSKVRENKESSSNSNQKEIKAEKKEMTVNSETKTHRSQNRHSTGNKERGDLLIENKVILNRDSIRKHYKVLEKIGSGSFGKVFKATHLPTNQERAIKVVKKSMLKYQDGDSHFLKEIQMLVSLDHPNIIKVFEYFEDEQNYYVVEELAVGGELYEQIAKLNSFSEKIAALIMRQILSAVVYLNENDIVHRDLKPENMLLESKSSLDDLHIKLVDFGTANYSKDNETMTLKVGTPYYIAPEVIKKKYDKQCDVWSCGVIMYILLCGYPPYDGEDDDDIMKSIINDNYEFPEEEWESITPSAKELISRMLEKDPAKRITPQEAIVHPWFISLLDNEEKDDKLMKTFDIKSHFSNLKKFSQKEKLQQACVSFLVHQLGATEQVNELRKIFLSLDKSKDGRLDYNEIIEGFKKLDSKFLNELEIDNIEDIIKRIDTDGSGYVEYEEFLVATVNKNLILSENNLKVAFDYFDKNNSGNLDQKEIKGLLLMLCKKDVCTKEIKKIIDEIDENKDGEISFDEFKGLMKKVLS